MKNLRKLLPGSKREPKILVAFSNRQVDCDRLIRYLARTAAKTPGHSYPIHAYCLEEPLESRRCEHVVVDSNSWRLYRKAQQELANSWVALSATSWNGVRRGGLLKLIPLTIPPFRAVIGNENGDFFQLRLLGLLRHSIDRFRQRWHDMSVDSRQWINVVVFWPGRHLKEWFRQKLRNKLVWGTAVTLGNIPWFADNVMPLTRKAFERLPAGKIAPLEPADDGSMKSGITRIESPGQEWRRDEIIPILENSNSRFVLFCPPDYMESFEDLLPLFEDQKTFAVTRQSGYREWRTIMLALSPFRILKPGEASRVSAPISPVVLVDRRKLKMLEIPKTMVFGAAWLALFWRAGAACWRSYSVGGTVSADQQLDYWLEEALFVRQLYTDPDLQKLASETPLLCRGNVTMRPDLAKPYRALPRVLVVAPYLPFPLSHGGAVRIYNLCKALADQVDFLLICFREVTDEVDYAELHKIFRRVYAVDRDEITTRPDLPMQVNHYETSSMRALIEAVGKEESVELMQIEYTDMAAYREAAPQTPAILVEHDITYTLHRQFTERDPSDAVVAEYERWFKFERERLAAFDSVFVMSDQDREEAVKSGASKPRTFVIPNGVDLQRFPALAPPEGESEVFYVGSFRHLPNYLGFEELRTTIMPLVWERFPEVKLRVVAGPDHEKHWRDALKGEAIPELDPRIIMHGFVADLLPLYKSAHVVAVPLPLSAGTNIKVMEALACQRAVVTTPVGAQGLGLKNDFDALICGLGQPFADALCLAIEDPLMRDQVARQGRLSAEARFGWDAIARDALDVYSLLIRESRAQRPTGNGRQREQQKKADEHENDHRSEGRGILESA